MNSNTNVIQVTNVSPSTTSEQMRTLFGFLGKIEELKLFPPDESPLPVTSRVCFVKFLESESVGVSQHLTNTVFVDRALIVVPFAEGVIPDEAKALSLLAPANAVAGLLPGGGLLPTPNPLASMGGVPLAALGGPTLDPALAALSLPGSNINPQSLTADQLLKLMTSVDPKLNHMAAGLNLNPGLKADASSKEIEEAMKRVREAQSLISAAIEPGNKKDDKRKHSRSRSRSRRRRSRSRSRHRRSKSRSRRRSRSRSRRRSKSPRRRKSHSKDRSRRTRSKSRDRKKEEKDKKRSKTPPKSYSTTRRSRSISRRRRRSRSASRSPKKSRSPKRKLSRSPSPRRHKKEKKKDKDREKERDRDRERKEEKDRSRDQRERSTSKKKKSKDKEKEREKKSDSEKGDVKCSKHGLLQAEMTNKAEVIEVTRDYDEEEQGYDSEKEKEVKKDADMAESPKPKEPSLEKTEGVMVKESKVNGDDHHEEDMDMSD
ncbi:serine/arginine-rich splicing factor 11-like isoform X1 [Megalops cyprinoides]|uniref:serine/arginine-rich splicing factor 11-like isoform X1 n=2 Tax=Megalops cyprinoides TaxID=118141 RepID=UPI001863B1BA|nr:serine/arginine-rich splicing factor 11-like isoform X1 [Megalops cyprinoides]